jgi:hypothetical protein
LSPYNEKLKAKFNISTSNEIDMSAKTYGTSRNTNDRSHNNFENPNNIFRISTSTNKRSKSMFHGNQM